MLCYVINLTTTLFFFKEVDKGVVGKGKNNTCTANLSTLI